MCLAKNTDTEVKLTLFKKQNKKRVVIFCSGKKYWRDK